MKTLPLLVSSIALLPWMAVSSVAQQEISVRALSFQPGFPVEIHAHVPTGEATAGRLQVKSFLNHEANLLTFSGHKLAFTVKSDPGSATDVNQRLGTVEFPESLKSAIVIFLPVSGKPGSFQSNVSVIDDSAGEFPPGSFKVANLGGSPIRIELDKKTYECPAGGTVVIAKAPFGNNQSVGMRAYCKRGGEWKLVTSGAWSNPGTRRVLEVFTEDPETKEIKLRGIRDVVTP